MTHDFDLFVIGGGSGGVRIVHIGGRGNEIIIQHDQRIDHLMDAGGAQRMAGQ